MFQGIVANNSVSFIIVFLEGLLSFFSPCVLPLIPIYMSYLAGSGKKTKEDGSIQYDIKKVFLHTVFFTTGISFAFFILGMSVSLLKGFFFDHRTLFTRIGGIIIIFLGLFQLGIFNFSFLQRDRRISHRLGDKKMNPLVALLMGFTFSFAWTPCVGPALASVLIMASGAQTAMTGNLLVLVYALGFLIPFLLLGLFTTQVLNFLKSKQKLLRYTVKLAGVLLILMGIMIFTGWMNRISGYLNTFSSPSRQSQWVNTSEDKKQGNIDKEDESDKQLNTDKQEDNDQPTDVDQKTDNDQPTDVDQQTDNNQQEDIPTLAAFDFTLKDQYGNTHTLSDYQGKVVFLNFWATWCPPCKEELPDIEELYQEFNLNQDEIVILGITNPSSLENPYTQEGSKEEVMDFIDQNGYTFPSLFDETGSVFQDYYISSFPTTFMITKEGNILGYVPGMMTKDIMYNIIQQTLDASEQ